MKTATWRNQLDTCVDRHWEQIVSIRRHLHCHPEPSGEETETSQFLFRLLQDAGASPHYGPEGRGVMVDCPAESMPRRLALRADIDALRIQDQKEVPYRSQQPGVMHACGHDAHTAMLAGALLTLLELESQGALPWPVSWRGIFQPSEETGTGAREMIECGAMEDIDAIIATHVDPTREAGKVGLRWGVLTANCDDTRLVVTGQGGHAARPHETIDPVAAAAQLMNSLYVMLPRTTDSQEALVLTIGQLLAGHNPNVVPEQVTLLGTLRSLDRRVRQEAKEKIRQVAQGVAIATGTKIDVEFNTGVLGVVNAPGLNHLLQIAATDVLGDDNVEAIPRPSMGSEDFAAYLDLAPGAMFRLGAAAPKATRTFLHSPMFDIDERALAIGAKILARTAVLWSDPRRDEKEDPACPN